MTTTRAVPEPLGYAVPATPGSVEGLRLNRNPLAWVAVLIPTGFVFWLFFLTPSL